MHPLVEQHVGGLGVAVDDAVRVQVRQALGDLARDAAAQAARERRGARRVKVPMEGPSALEGEDDAGGALVVR
eukprot:5708582-Prymnesium_polylepis.1